MASAPSSITLEEFAALNEEMAMLTQAGVPLEQGLTDLGRDWRGRVGRTAEYLGAQLSSGRNLADVLADPAMDFPPAYRTAVIAGMRSGRLASALEEVASVAARAAESRRLTWLALLYPIIIVAIAYSLGMLLLLKIFPVFFEFFHSLRLPAVSGWTRLEHLRSFAAGGGWWLLPLAFAIGGWLLWRRAGRAAALDSRGGRWLPTEWNSVFQVNHWGRIALFADLLALLVEHDVPTVEALELAGNSAGDAKLAAGAKALAERMRRGESLRQLSLPEKKDAKNVALPSRMIWLIASGRDRVSWSLTLRRTAAAYRARANHTLEWMTTMLPILLAAIVGGITLLIYGLISIWPFVTLLYELESL